MLQSCRSPPPSELFEKSKTVPLFGTRILSHIVEADIDSTSIDSQCERTPPPWEQRDIMFDTSLSCFQKDQTSETVFWKEYQQLRERYNSYFEAYTDGSKCEQKVAAAASFPKDPDDSGTIHLRHGCFVFNAKLEGIHLALKKFLSMTKLTRILSSILTAFRLLKACHEKTSEPKISRVSTVTSKNCQRRYRLS